MSQDEVFGFRSIFGRNLHLLVALPIGNCTTRYLGDDVRHGNYPTTGTRRAQAMNRRDEQMNNTLRWITSEVSRLKPRESITINRNLLGKVHAMPPWTPPERVMENVIGSSYDIVMDATPYGDVRYTRLQKPLADGRRTYVSPDRRHYFTFDGMYWSHR